MARTSEHLGGIDGHGRTGGRQLAKPLFRYRAKGHAKLPHVVKFSGGRSSGMLLFSLLENGMLDAGRGDVIVFNNTSAEHPDTYRFVRRCMEEAARFGIPFLWLEYQTYEDARGGEWTRQPTYRLVNAAPRSDVNPDGFQWRGEAFEEMLSHSGFVPNQFDRTCTRKLKLDVTRAFLADWLSSNPAIPRLGHYGEASRMDLESAHRRHQRHGGGVPKVVFERKRGYSWSRPHFRPEQRFSDYCGNWTFFRNPELAGRTFGGKADLSQGGMEYVALIGLRADEPQRVARVAARDAGASGFEGEHVYMPLAEMSATREDVNAHWAARPWDLALPQDASLSNCVFCFLKGVGNLSALRARMAGEGSKAEGFGPLADTPSDWNWWARMEATYGRDYEEEGRESRCGVRMIGFFGKDGGTYAEMTDSSAPCEDAAAMLPCDCTE